jgi:hypothetical protein
MDSSETTTNNNEVQPVALAKAKVEMTTDTAKYNADGSLASLSATYPVDTGDTTDTATYDADGRLASLSSTYPVDSERVGTGITETPPKKHGRLTGGAVSAITEPRADTWDEVNTFRKALKENARGYLAVSASVVVGTCFLVSILAGTILASPVIFVVSTYDHLHKFFTNRKRKKAATETAGLVTEKAGPAGSNLRVVRSSEGE